MTGFLALGLPGMAKSFPDQRTSPDLAALSFEERVGIMADREVAERDTKRLTARFKFAALRQDACVEDIDLRTPRGLDRALLARLVAGDWIDRHQMLISGTTGIGKSWLGCALGHKANCDGRSVLCQRVLLILDDWGLSVLNHSKRIELLEILENRCGRGSTLVTSQVPVDQWHEVIGSPTLGDAILDRLIHNAYRTAITGESMRKITGKRSLDASQNS